MKTLNRTTTAAVVALAVVLGVSMSSLAGGVTVRHQVASTHVVQAKKVTTITCVKGKATKKVTGTNPKCPKGWTLKPVYVTDTFNASYSGTISITWNSSGPSTASITGTGKGTNFGFTSVKGSGSSTATAQTDPINGTGTLTGSGETLTVKFDTHATASATGSSAPTTVVISGTANITKGTGKFAGATGSFKVSGTFNIQSTSGSEKDPFSATLKGAVKVQKS
jgi:hypothetical protein